MSSESSSECSTQSSADISEEPLVTISIGLKKMSATILENRQVIKSPSGKTFIPAYISFVTKTARIGDGAAADYQNHPKFVIYDILKLIGKTYDKVEKDKEWGFELEKRNNGTNKFDVIFETANGKRAADPVILLSMLFKCMIQIIKGQYKQPINVVKINLPPSELKTQECVEEAAYIAGFQAVF